MAFLRVDTNSASSEGWLDWTWWKTFPYIQRNCLNTYIIGATVAYTARPILTLIMVQR